MNGAVRLLLLGCLLAGALGATVTGGTYAFITSGASGKGNGFSAGTLRLEAAETAGETLNASNLVPGDRVISRLTLTSMGTLTLRYAMTVSQGGDPALAGGLLLTIRTATPNPCSAEDGTLLYGPGPASSASLGDPAGGQQPGDRSLAAASNEALCFLLEMPGDAPLSLQGAGSTLTFHFHAEQG